MGRLTYLLEREKVARRGAANVVKYLLGKPFERRGRTGERAVAFVRLNARGRVFNLAYGLRAYHGLRTILVTRLFDYAFQRKAFDEIHLFLSYRHLVRIVEDLGRRYDLLAVIGMTQPARQSLELLDMERRWPVLVDPYDSYWAMSHFTGMWPRSHPSVFWTEEEIAAERDCFARADAILARHRYITLLLESVGLEKPVLPLEDRCNRLFFQEVSASARPRGREWSVAYAGIFYPMDWDSTCRGEVQLLPLGPHFAREKIHFHLYPSPHHNYRYPEYRAESRRNPYFHIHPPASFGKIHRVLAEHDFGWAVIDPARNKLFASDTIARNTSPIKLCTFLEAGLPIVSNCLFSSYEAAVKRLGAGIAVGADAPRGLAAAIEGADIARIRRNVEAARGALELEEASAALHSFLGEVRARFSRAPWLR